MAGVLTFAYINAAEIVTLATILPLLCISAVGLRFYARVSNGYNVGVDDWLMVPGALLYVAMCICLLIGAAHNAYDAGTPTSPALPSYLVPRNEILAKLFYAFQVLLVIGFGFIKCSIIALYRRIFVSKKNSIFDIVCKVMTGIVVAWSISFFVIVNLSCGRHISSFWGTRTEEGRCESFTPTRGLAGSDMIIDVALMLLPQPLIWSLKLSVCKKIVISVLIALGCACIGADIAQTILFGQIARASQLDVPLDENRIVALVMYYTCIDGGLAVTAACLVTLRPLFRNTSVQSVVQGFKSGFSHSSSTSQESNIGKIWDSSGTTESSSGTQTDDLEKGPLYVVERGVPTPVQRATESRLSRSRALSFNQYGYAEGKMMSAIDIKQVDVRAKRGSESVALASADKCVSCGHGA